MKNRRMLIPFLLVALLVGGSLLSAHFAVDAAPAPKEQYRAAAIDAGGYVQHAVLLDDAAYTMANTTPVNGGAVCIAGDASQFAAELTLSGTMTGTAPTLAVVLQHSIDGGLHWNTVNTFTTINATVTPASQYVSFSDVPASTAVTWGDCFRARYTFGGTGTVVANVGLHLIGK